MYINKIIFVLLLVALLGIIYFQSKVMEGFNNKKCDFSHLILNNTQLSDLHELLLVFIEICEKEKINYFAIGGTLLGTVRSGGLLPFDDDIDLGVLDDDYEKLKNYMNQYNNDTYYFEDIFFGHKFKKRNSDVFIDIMIFEKVNDKYVIDPNNNPWPESSFNNIDEILPLEKLPYNGFLINVPNKYIDYLHRNYPEWDTKIKMDCGHINNNNNKDDYDKCVYEIHNVPSEIDIDYQDSKYNCYSDFYPLSKD
jgi:hypothetical protein